MSKNKLQNTKLKSKLLMGVTIVALTTSLTVPTSANVIHMKKYYGTNDNIVQMKKYYGTDERQFQTPIESFASIDRTNEGTGLNSNNDYTRRSALEKEYNIKLDKKDVWDDRGGQESPMGTKYTSHSDMKKLGIYATNANRQDLIQYGIRTGDWQPYRAMSAKENPTYFALVDGKYEYTKIYYGKMMQTSIKAYNRLISEASGDKKRQEELIKAKEQYIKNNINLFNDAPGIVPYVAHLNHSEDLAEKTGAKRPDKEYFNSVWNNPSILLGKYPDGYNPYTSDLSLSEFYDYKYDDDGFFNPDWKIDREKKSTKENKKDNDNNKQAKKNKDNSKDEDKEDKVSVTRTGDSISFDNITYEELEQWLKENAGH